MLQSIILQPGAVRRVIGYEAYRHRNELGDILSSGWFWIIAGIIGFCVLIAVLKGNEKKK